MTIATLIVGQELVIYFVSVQSGMWIADPSIHCVRSCVQSQCINGLTKCSIGSAAVCTQFDKHPRPQCAHEPKCKRSMCKPSRLDNAFWNPKHRRSRGGVGQHPC